VGEAEEEEDGAVKQEEEEQQQQGEEKGSSNLRHLTRCKKVTSSQKSMPYHETFLGCSICGVLS